MGSSSSKPARAAANAAKRQYPQSPSPATTARAPQPPQPPPPPQPSDAGETAHAEASKNLDSSNNSNSSTTTTTTNNDNNDIRREQDFAATVRAMGQVTPAPTLSRSSTFNRQQPRSSHQQPQVSPAHANPARQNPTVLTLQNRARLSRRANEEFERLGRTGGGGDNDGDGGGREFLDVQTIRQILSSRDLYKVEPRVIEKRLGLKKGVVERLDGAAAAGNGGDGAGGGGGRGNGVFGNP